MEEEEGRRTKGDRREGGRKEGEKEVRKKSGKDGWRQGEREGERKEMRRLLAPHWPLDPCRVASHHLIEPQSLSAA